MTKIKIGILNFQYSDHNYGAVLQASALESVVNGLGYNAQHIDYIPYDKNQIKNKIKYGFLGHIIKFFLGKSNLFSYTMNNNVFEEFRQKWITRTTDVYLNSSDLTKIASNYAGLIVGSDQVWRYSMFFSEHDYHAYFLQFASDSTIKISYAASFGVDHWEKNDDPIITNSIKSYLSKFDAISVREDSGVKICNDIFSVNSTHVLDPTLLAGKEFFDKIISSSSIASSNNQRKPTIVYYKLDITKDFKNKLKKISNTLNIQTKNIYYSEGIFYNKYINVTSWLEQIKNSTLVITDSFHCVCFSIIFNKNFVCIKNKNRGESRLFSLLGSLGLTDRFITEDELDTCLENIQDIDYTKINTIIEEQRKNSLTFLINALSKTNAIR